MERNLAWSYTSSFSVTIISDNPLDMFRLWTLAEQDLLSEDVPYRLRDTGQGLNRVQHCPKTSRLMHSILHQAQKSVGSWSKPYLLS